MGGRSQNWQARSVGAGKLFIVIDGCWMLTTTKTAAAFPERF